MKGIMNNTTVDLNCEQHNALIQAVKILEDSFKMPVFQRLRQPGEGLGGLDKRSRHHLQQVQDDAVRRILRWEPESARTS